MSKRRKTPRAPIAIQVNYHSVDNFLRDFADDLSTGGMFIATMNPLEPGTQLILEFLLPGHNYPIRVKAEVMWSRTKLTSTDQRRGMGVKFKDLSDSAREKIDSIIKKYGSAP
ncbi:MAG: TIGR02266 family protein [Deltaproteobacteria bacterium]|nr:TIGR02266 family protein [Deltaproteobacteria bacterium]MBW1946443.1 TIGR02266 family protein [Deltaproteobacteria bacterium]MBW1965893.1 TIGR02266 family protein [Deltaproteobacteria bacterium]MBW2097789.1 TIGR02266 family protein [Deltaproteobacteria bacterium]